MSQQIQAVPLTLPGRIAVTTRSWRTGLRTRRAPYDRFAGETLCAVPPTLPTFSRFTPITQPGAQTTFACRGYGACVLHLAGRWHGLVSFTASDDGVVWSPIALTAFTTGTVETEATGPGMWRTPSGFTGRFLRMQVHSLAAGMITGTFGAAPSPEEQGIPLSHAA